jgi:hypothetical protein
MKSLRYNLCQWQQHWDDDDDGDDFYLYEITNEGVKKSIPYVSI